MAAVADVPEADNDQDNRAATEISLFKTACFAASVHRIVIRRCSGCQI